MEDLKEELRDWTAKLIQDKGGASKVSELTGINYMVLRQIVLKERHPTWDVFVKLRRRWPKEVNLNALAMGETESKDPDSSEDFAHVGMSPESKIQAEAIMKLTNAYEKLANDIEVERKDSSEQMKNLIKTNQDLSASLLNFYPVTNDTTGDADQFIEGMQFAQRLQPNFSLKSYVQKHLMGLA